jgi:hypothetical protein
MNTSARWNLVIPEFSETDPYICGIPALNNFYIREWRGCYVRVSKSLAISLEKKRTERISELGF